MCVFMDAQYLSIGGEQDLEVYSDAASLTVMNGAECEGRNLRCWRESLHN